MLNLLRYIVTFAVHPEFQVSCFVPIFSGYVSIHDENLPIYDVLLTMWSRVGAPREAEIFSVANKAQ